MGVVSIENENKNPQFVSLEINFGDIKDKNAIINVGGIRKNLVYYELDLQKNIVSIKKSIEVDSTSHMLIPVPKN